MNKNYYVYLFMSFALTVSLSGCLHKKEDFNSIKNNNKNTERETTVIIVDNNDCDNNLEFDNSDSNYDNNNNNYIVKEELDYYLLEQVYKTLVSANENIYNGFSKVSLSEILVSNGYNNGNEVDNEMNNLNTLIGQYIDCYNKNEFEACNKLLNDLDNYYNNSIIGRNGLYNLLIKPNLDSSYQLDLGTDQYGHGSNYQGGVYLENGSLVRCVGLDDDLLIPRDGIVEECEYFSKLPTIIDNHYICLGVDNNSNTCYIVNDVEVNSIINNLWDNLLKDAGEMYQVDPSKVQILLNNDMDYVFSDDKGFIFGLLSYDQKSIVEKIYVILDILNKKEFDPLLLDSYIEDLYSESTLVYSK